MNERGNERENEMSRISWAFSRSQKETERKCRAISKSTWKGREMEGASAKLTFNRASLVSLTIHCSEISP